MNQKQQKNILATIAYHNAMDYPLTTFEVWRHLVDLGKAKEKISFSEITDQLQILKNVGWIGCESGFWFLKGKKDLVTARIKRQKISLAKIKHARFWAKLMGLLPFVRAVFLTGTLSLKRADVVSDWDVLVVTKKKRIWLARFVLTGTLFLLGKWRYKDKTKDRFCLNHFITEESYILEEQNEFTAKEISFSVPLCGQLQYKKYQQLNESWVQRYKPNYEKDQICSEILINEPSCGWKRFQAAAEIILEKIRLGHYLNSAIKKIMIKKINRNPLTYLPGADIRYNDQALVFLPTPQREKIIQKVVFELTKSRP